MSIQPIEGSGPCELLRNAIDEILLGNVPAVGGALAALGRVVAPSALDIEVSRWRADVTTTVNALEGLLDRLTGSVQLSELALRIGVHVANESEDGIPEPYAIDRLVERFSATPDASVIDACGELEYVGLAKVDPLVNSAGYLFPRVSFFEAFDPFVHRWHPTVDAAHLGVYVADCSTSDGTVGAEEMARHFGWAHRRLNPPLQIVASYISDGRKFTGYAPPWACRHLWADPSERAALRDMARQILGNSA